MAPADSALLAAVEQSPYAAASHDRSGWLGLFTADGRVEDPVGSRPHVGAVQIGRFYDTFIGPRDVVFHRDLELGVVMGPAIAMTIGDSSIRPARGQRRMEDRAAASLLGTAKHAVAILAQRRISDAGHHPTVARTHPQSAVARTAGFVTGFRRVGSRHKSVVEAFVNAVARGDRSAALRTLSSDATMTFGDDDAADSTDVVGLFAQLNGANAKRLIGAGSTVAASMTTGQGRGIMFADVARRGNEIRRIRYFPG
jgi:Nuclear transport factor 2 (NTF2) domain